MANVPTGAPARANPCPQPCARRTEIPGEGPAASADLSWRKGDALLGLTVEAQARLLVEELTSHASRASFAELTRLTHRITEPLLAAEPSLQKAFARECLRAGGLAGLEMLQRQALKLAAGRILRGRLAWQDSEVADLARLCADIDHEASPVSSVLKLVEARPAVAALASALDTLRRALAPWQDRREVRGLLRRIDACNSRAFGGALPQLQPEGPWTERAYRELTANRGGEVWVRVFQHARLLAQGEPARSWLHTAASLVEEVGVIEFRAAVGRWLRWGPTAGRGGMQVSPEEAAVQRGLLWFLPGYADGVLCAAIADFAEECLRRVPGLGPVSHRTGFACIQVLAATPGPAALMQLARLASRLRDAAARGFAAEALAEAAFAAGADPAEIEELTLPTFGLDAAGTLREDLGDVTAEVRVTGSSVTATWTDGSGNRSRSMPARLHESHPEEVRELRGAIQTLDALLSSQRARLERLMRSGRQIPFERWQTCYLEHPLVGGVAKRLIWEFGVQGRTRTAIWRDGRLLRQNGRLVEPGLPVRLWHPLRSDARTVRAWQRWLEERQVTQPFPQAHRDVYRISPAEQAEPMASRRFAGHVLRSNALATQFRERGWSFEPGRSLDYPPAAWLEMPEWNLRAELRLIPLADPAAATPPDHSYLEPGELRFCRSVPSLGNTLRMPGSRRRTAIRQLAGNPGEPLDVGFAEPPPAVLSEVLRDVDLVIQAASVGADPEYGLRPEEPFARYWRDFAFGPLTTAGQSRRDVLARLLPALPIASRCRIEDPFLLVQGQRALYRIHLGSGHVLLEPGGRYLWVNPGGSAPRVYLPFEGDRVLEIVLSKACLLANDRGVKDWRLLRELPPLPERDWPRLQ